MKRVDGGKFWKVLRETKPLWREGDGGPAHVPPVVGLPHILSTLVVVVVVLP